MSRTSYADSAQGRELDRRMDQYGQPMVVREDFCHVYDRKESKEQEREYQASLSKRRAIALAEMEQFFYPERQPDGL
jgi:hypothetical protein